MVDWVKVRVRVRARVWPKLREELNLGLGCHEGDLRELRVGYLRVQHATYCTKPPLHSCDEPPCCILC